MVNYLTRRLLMSVPLLIGISIVVFGLLQATPGGPLSNGGEGAGAQLSPEQIERLRDEYGLDDPLPVQYLSWAGGIVTGDWGTSLRTGRPVLEMIVDRLPATLLLIGLAFAISLAIAIPVGIVAARRQHSTFDYVATGVSFAGFATPSFWFGLMLLFLFSYSLGWLPSSGLEDLRETHTGLDSLWDRMQHLIMPVAVLALVTTASLARYVRASMLEVLDQDYIRTARGSGLPERTVVMRHALKNAAIPVVTVAVLAVPELFLGTAITETIFSIPGIGRLFIESADQRDYPVLLGILVIASLLVVLANIVADLLYALLDPRIAYG